MQMMMMMRMMRRQNQSLFLMIRHYNSRQGPPPVNPDYTQETNEEFEQRLLKLKNMAHQAKLREQQAFNKRANQDVFEYDEEEEEQEETTTVNTPSIFSHKHPNYLLYRKIVFLVGAFAMGMSIFLYNKYKNELAITAATTATTAATERTGRGITIDSTIEQQKLAMQELQADILKMEKQIRSELNISKKEAKQLREDIRAEAVKRVKKMREESM
jgi:hypothetical protein